MVGRHSVRQADHRVSAMIWRLRGLRFPRLSPIVVRAMPPNRAFIHVIAKCRSGIHRCRVSVGVQALLSDSQMVCAFGEISDTYCVRLCIMIRWHTLGKARSHRLWLTMSKTSEKGPGSDREGQKRTALV